MSTTTTVEVKVSSFGEQLRLWRNHAGLTLKEAADRATEQLKGSGQSLSYGTVQRYEIAGRPLQSMRADYIVAITYGLGHHISELPPQVREYIESWSSLLRKPCFPLSTLVAA
jgi:transcriptional regulator with XRE-family HTH domain